MTQLIGGALWASVAVTVIAALLAAIAGTFIGFRRPAAATRCALWLIVLSTCLLAPAVILGAMNLPSVRFAEAAADVQRAQTQAARRDVGRPIRLRGNAFAPRTLLQRPTLPEDVARAVAAVWIGGALVGCAGLLRSVARVRALKRRSSPLEGSLPDDLPWLTQRHGREIYFATFLRDRDADRDRISPSRYSYSDGDGDARRTHRDRTARHTRIRASRALR